MIYTKDMKIERKAVFELLKTTPLFCDIEKPVLDWLAGQFQLIVYYDKESIFTEGDPSEDLYLIYEGKIQLSTYRKKEDVDFALLNRGDVFGEESFLYDDPRYYQAKASGTVILLRWHVEGFIENQDLFADLEERLEVLINSRELSTRVNLPWLQKDEYVHVISRRHPVILWQKIVPPIIFGIVAVILSALLQWYWFPGKSVGWIVFSASISISLLWLVWNYFNWRTDYFIVTNKRVVWIEKVALIYESRQEAPLRTIMSVGVQRSRVGSVLDFADVVVMTYVGTIRLQNLRHADTVASLVESYWHHNADQNKQEEAKAIAQLLHEKLDLPWQDDDETWVHPVGEEAEEDDDEKKEPGFFRWLFSDFIRLRFEKGQVITYRKHWFVLIKKTWLPFLLMGLSLAGLVLRWGGMFTFISLTLSTIGFLTLAFIFFVWMVYQYADWHNDQFKLTMDQIIDIDRKPLGKVRRRSAPLENVLSIEYERLGFWGFLFNFGTVSIAVGNMKLTFDHVYQPSRVQQDIFYRMGERLDSIKQFEIKNERDRVSEWIASYHRRLNKLREIEANQPPSKDDPTRKLE